MKILLLLLVYLLAKTVFAYNIEKGDLAIMNDSSKIIFYQELEKIKEIDLGISVSLFRIMAYKENTVLAFCFYEGRLSFISINDGDVSPPKDLGIISLCGPYSPDLDGFMYMYGINKENEFEILSFKNGKLSKLVALGATRILMAFGPSFDGIFYVIGRDIDKKLVLMPIKRNLLLGVIKLDIKKIENVYLNDPNGIFYVKGMEKENEPTVIIIEKGQIKGRIKLDVGKILWACSQSNKDDFYILGVANADKLLLRKIKNYRITEEIDLGFSYLVNTYGDNPESGVFFVGFLKEKIVALFLGKDEKLSKLIEINLESVLHGSYLDGPKTLYLLGKDEFSNLVIVSIFNEKILKSIKLNVGPRVLRYPSNAVFPPYFVNDTPWSITSFKYGDDIKLKSQQLKQGPLCLIWVEGSMFSLKEIIKKYNFLRENFDGKEFQKLAKIIINIDFHRIKNLDGVAFYHIIQSILLKQYDNDEFSAILYPLLENLLNEEQHPLRPYAASILADLFYGKTQLTGGIFVNKPNYPRIDIKEEQKNPHFFKKLANTIYLARLLSIAESLNKSSLFMAICLALIDLGYLEEGEELSIDTIEKLSMKNSFDSLSTS